MADSAGLASGLPTVVELRAARSLAGPHAHNCYDVLARDREAGACPQGARAWEGTDGGDCARSAVTASINGSTISLRSNESSVAITASGNSHHAAASRRATVASSKRLRISLAGLPPTIA